MQIRHIKTVVQAVESLNRITALAWSPNNQKLAVVGVDRIIYLFDETGEKKDRFATKPADPKNPRNYSVCGLAFSPDSTRLAVAQTDGVVFVYKLGLDWGEKKSICNKFIQSADITCLTWPKEQPNALVFGLSDGKVRVGNLKTNKAATLYQVESPPISTASSPDGVAVITGHMDGSIYRFFFEDGMNGASQGKFSTHKCPPVALGWGESIVVAGNDQKIVFYDSEGKIIQEHDYSKDDSEYEFMVAEFSPSGQSVVIGSFDRLHIFNYNVSLGNWEEAPIKILENFYTINALAWKPDGSRLAAGSMCGAVELFDCCLRRYKYNGKFEFTYISPSQVIVKRLSTGSRIVLKSHYGYEISKVNIFQDQFLIAHTTETLLMGDLASCKLSEIPWRGGGNEKFIFEYMSVCMVFNAGELSIVEYGINDILASCRTEHINPHLISVRMNERKNDKDVKRIAYLVDLQTIQLLDMTNGAMLANISHGIKIDWLELSGKGNKLLFRDKRRQLHLYDVEADTRTTLLSYCSYAQWVPRSDVVVAQNRGNLSIWYSIDNPERVTMFPIKGEIEEIVRGNGKTEVIVDEGVNTVSYTLDEGLIEFGTAVEDRDYDRAVSLLETLEISPESQAMWKTLSKMALEDKKLMIASRCYAALGDVPRIRYMRNLLQLSEDLKEKIPMLENTMDHYLIKCKLASLNQQYKQAETLFLEQGRVDEAMDMYQKMHKWDQAIKVAEAKNHPELANLRQNYYTWLLESGQEEKAAELQEDQGDIMNAIQLYLKAGMPGKAATLLSRHNLYSSRDVTERVAATLYANGMYEKGGDLFEKLGNTNKALECYKAGKAFRPAVELCRSHFPNEVVELEEQWGDYLVSQKKLDAAINHYIEAGKSKKAVDAAIGAKQWKKAVSIVECLPPEENAKPYFIQLGRHFEESTELSTAEKYFVLAGRPQDAVDMYTRVHKWEKAHSLAITYMTSEEVSFLYISQAREMESKGKLKEAEKIYITVGEPDLAINMYKNHKQYDNMIRLVTSYHKDLLDETHLYLAKTLEAEGSFKQAEYHYIEGKDWKSAVNMYCANNMYEEAYRVSKAQGGQTSAKQVAYLWARSLGGEAAVKLLSKFGLLDAAIDFATENTAFEFAFELSKYADKYRLPDIYYKHAMYLEDEGKFKEAENSFILAGKPKEAILMYIHNEDWDSARMVAETYDPSSVGDVLVGQAKVSFEQKDFAKCETLLLRAQCPEYALKLYKEANMWQDALRFATEYLPARTSDIHKEYGLYLNTKGDTGRDEILSTAKMLEQQKEYTKAIELYLKLGPSQIEDLGQLETVWEKAVELCMKFVPERGPDVVGNVCQRLIGIGRFETAAEFYSGVEMYKEAMETYIQANNWEKARGLLRYAPHLTDYVESAYITYLKQHGAIEALVDVDVTAGLDLYAQRGEWEKCLEKANNQSKDLLNRYLEMYMRHLINEGKHELGVDQFLKYGVPYIPSNTSLYDILAKETLKKYEHTCVNKLRDMLFKLLQKPLVTPEVVKSLSEAMMISHLASLKNYCLQKKELLPFAAKLACALLRYVKIIPVDKAFYEAGQATKAAGIASMAFVCWNRYLDISEAIEDGDASALENADFANTDVPFDVPLPKENLPESIREEVRDWVLAISLDQKVNQEIEKRNCEECNARIYEASLFCYNCRAIHEPCIVTGYPVLKNRVRCTHCNKPANKEDWNKFVITEKVCPWCGNAQNPSYSLK